MLYYAPENKKETFHLTNETDVIQFVEELNNDIQLFLLENPNQKIRLSWHDDFIIYNFGSIKFNEIDFRLSDPCIDFDVIGDKGESIAYFSIALNSKIHYYMECWDYQEENINILRLRIESIALDD